MAHQKVQVRYGTTSEVNSVVLDLDEVVLNRTTGNLHIGDALTSGGKWILPGMALGGGLYTGSTAFRTTASRNLFGGANGSYTSPTRDNTNINLYDGGATNWSGIGSHTDGSMYFVTGTSAPASAMRIGITGQVIALTNSFLSQGASGGFFTDDRSSGTGTSGLYRQANLTRIWSSLYGDAISFLDSGFVGINNNSPARPLDVTGTVRSSAEFQSTSASGVAYRMVTSTYGSFWYSDTANVYFLVTNSADQYGSFNSLRPLIINLPTGIVSLSESAVVANALAGRTAFQASGIGGNLLIDYIGGGSNYYDATTHFFRSFGGGTTWLTINSSEILSPLNIRSSTSFSISSAQSAVHYKSSSNGSGFISGRSAAGTNANDFFLYDAVNAAFRWYVGTTGLMGIGTTTLGPTRLTVNGGVVVTDDGNNFTSSVNGLHSHFFSNTGYIYSIQNGVAWRQLNVDAAPLVLNGSSFGYIGVHIFAPLVKFHIWDSSNSTVVQQLLLHNEGAGNHTAAIGFQVSSSGEYTTLGPKGGIAFQRTTTNGRGLFQIYNRTTNDTAAYAAGDLRFGIGVGLYSAGATGGDKGADTINIGTYYSVGKAMMANDGTYNFLYDGQGNQAVFLGPTADPTNYSRNTNHNFGSIAGGATYFAMNATNAVFSLNVLPAADNTYSAGSASFRFTAFWGVNGAIQTSDERDKILLGCDLGLAFICALEPQSWNWKSGGNEVIDQIPIKNEFGHITGHELVLQSKPGQRRHYGLVAQQVKKVLGDQDFGGWVLTDKNDPDSQQALRMDQFFAPVIRSIQELREIAFNQSHMINEQATMIAELKQRLN